MRFSPESTDPSNAGLSIIRDLLHPVKVDFMHFFSRFSLESKTIGHPVLPCVIEITPDEPSGDFERGSVGDCRLCWY